MFRVLGVLVVALAVATVLLLVVMRRVVAPALRRRHVERILEENKRLDDLIGSETTKQRRTR